MKRNLKESQRAEVLNHLIQRTTITDTQARSEYGIGRLASRINNLRDLGVEIETIPVAFKTRKGNYGRFAMYKLQSRAIPAQAMPLLDQDSLVWVGETF